MPHTDKTEGVGWGGEQFLAAASRVNEACDLHTDLDLQAAPGMTEG